jgi:hypothetical protein
MGPSDRAGALEAAWKPIPEGVDHVDLLLSRTGPGGTFEVLASGVANTGSYAWTVSGTPTTNAFLQVVAHNPAGPGALSGVDVSDRPFKITDGIVGIDPAPLPEQFALTMVAPNPARGSLRIGFALPRNAEVRLDVLDVLGRRVASVAHGEYAAGVHDVRWNARGDRGDFVAAGIYFARLEVSGRTFTRRFVIAR